MASFQPQEKLFKKFSHKINVDEFRLPTTAADEDRVRVKDKQDRATAEQVMDPRTRMILFKLMNRGFVTQINGCISTGKEANVYHATGKDGVHLALKIYKTSILVFKDRDKYVTGEFRLIKYFTAIHVYLKQVLWIILIVVIQIPSRLLQAQPKKNGPNVG